MYEKFGLSQAERTAMKRFLGAALVNIVPRAWRTDFLRNYNCRPPPFFMPVVSLLEVGVFIYYAILLGRGGRPVTAFEGLPNPNVLMYVPTRRYEAWRYITYMLVHQGYIHLLFNLCFQLFLGLPLEIVHKWWRVALVYVGGVVGGSLAHSVTDISVNLAGASGGCYAIIGAHIASVILNWKEMNFKCSAKDPVRLLTSAYVRLTLLVLLIGADAVNAVYRRFYEPDNFKVGITAHIGGLLLGVIVLKNVNILSWERRIGWAALAIWLAAILVCILINGLRTGYPETDFTSIYSQF
ncbi:RHBL2-like protein [Mya arenaria]|uniref:RHBL2-like protein n=1 Tax=Mya arenaria TaxID=6604 RepID=A0ABY7FD71_MYAAR|nr:RHBL2-like protein [Mya arenaria]